MQVTPYETAASKVTGTKRSEVSPTFQLASKFPGLVAMVHCYLWSIFKPRMKYGFLILQINNYKNCLHWTVTKTESPGQCISQPRVWLPVKLRIHRALREESGLKCLSEPKVHLVLYGYTLSSPTGRGEERVRNRGKLKKKKSKKNALHKQKNNPQFNNSFLGRKHAQTSLLQTQV